MCYPIFLKEGLKVGLVMKIGHYKKWFQRILDAEHPNIAFRHFYFELMDEGLEAQAILGILVDIYWQNKRHLDSKGSSEKAIRDMGDQIEKFRPYKTDLIKAVLAQDGGDTMVAEVERLSKQGLSKLEIYYIFLGLFSYAQYRAKFYHNIQEHQYDLISDAILDRLWGGGWDKGNRLLPDEPDVCDLLTEEVYD